MSDEKIGTTKTTLEMVVEGRHPSTVHLAQYFAYDHLPPALQLVSRWCYILAETMIHKLPDGPELTAGLRKLLEAKDCFVRAGLPELDTS